MADPPLRTSSLTTAGVRSGRYFIVLVGISALAYMPLAAAFKPWEWSQFGPFAFQPGFTLEYVVYFFAGDRLAPGYRRRMARYAEMRVFDLWYEHIDVEEIFASLPLAARARLRARVEKARARSVVEHDFPKLT